MKLLLLKLVYRASLVALSCGCLMLAPVEIVARVGGGQSYGGGSSGGNGGSDDGGAIVWLLFELLRLLIYLTIEYPAIGIPLDIIFIIGVIYFITRKRNAAVSFSSITYSPQSSVTQGARPNVLANNLPRLRKFDPNFSEIVFTDFAYALYGKAHEARGRGAAALEIFSPYLSEAARKSLLGLNPPGIQEVKGIIVGSMQVGQVDGLVTPTVRVSLVFETNYTEVTKAANGAPSEMSYYVTERWELERKRDLLSPPPAQATALHCPRCGAPLQRNPVGACAYCGTKIDSGEFQWYVRKIALLGKEARGPLLTSDVPEAGTDLPSVIQPGLGLRQVDFNRNNPEFSWPDFEARARLIFNELQAAWSSLNWERARPHETDNIFQMHQYWIDAYRRQGLRNVVEDCVIDSMQPVKIQDDAFYEAITLRIWAHGRDYTVDNTGKVVSGSSQKIRKWSEYWTFIRNRNAKPAAIRTDLNCPNCGSPLKVNASGICEFCGGKITSGEFDWVLSKIEQDESYAG
jgi:Tim44-like domain